MICRGRTIVTIPYRDARSVRPSSSKGYCIHYVRPWCHSVTCRVRYVPSRDARKCLVGGRPSPSKVIPSRLASQILRRRDCNDNGRTGRASLLESSRFDATDALSLNTSRASLQRVTRIVLCPLYIRVPTLDGSGELVLSFVGDRNKETVA